MHRGLWNMAHASFFSEATLIEIGVYVLRYLSPVTTVSTGNAWGHERWFGPTHEKKRNACIFWVSPLEQARLKTSTDCRVWALCSFFTIKTVSRKERLDAFHWLFQCVWWTCLPRFPLKKGECNVAKFIHFPSLKSLVWRKQDVTSSTVSLEGKDTETMREDVVCEIPADGECTTLLILCGWMRLSTTRFY